MNKQIDVCCVDNCSSSRTPKLGVECCSLDETLNLRTIAQFSGGIIMGDKELLLLRLTLACQQGLVPFLSTGSPVLDCVRAMAEDTLPLFSSLVTPLPATSLNALE